MAECLDKLLHDVDNNLHYSYDTDEDDDYEEFCENFIFSQAPACFVCNGYYAPNYGEPLCGTCHAFLFPVIEEKSATDLSDNDEDSGNDEPPYNSVVSLSTNRNNQDADASANDDDDDNGNDDNNDVSESPELVEAAIEDHSGNKENPFSVDRPNPDPPRTLRQYLNMLTEPKDGNVTGALNASKRRVSNEPVNICTLPVEVLLLIFSYLDDLSLCNVGHVCKQWRGILEAHTPQAMWQKYTKQRWPLFQQIVNVSDWFKIYSSLMSSCSCRTCLIQMTLKTPQQRENHFRATRLRGDIRTLDVDAAEGIQAVPLDNQLSHWQASIIGPAGSPYEGGKFFLHIIIPFSYPMGPPVVRFLTKIVHPNVSRHGDVGIDIIQHNWSLALTISKLLISVQSLLTDPFTEICMEPELGRLYESNRPKFEALARRWTWKYAMFEAIPT